MGWTFFILAILAFVILGFLVFLILFEPGLEYKVCPRPIPLDSDEFLLLLGALSDSQVHQRSTIRVLTNGDQFYTAELEAIRAAKQSINLEAYIFYRGEIGRMFVEALTGRARAGIKVKVVVDAIGSFMTPRSFFKDLEDAGGRMEWYQ